MPPALLLLRVGRMRRGFLPLPLFLLWPFLLAAWLVLGLGWLVTAGRSRQVLAGVTALRVLGELRGTSISVRGAEGAFSMRFV